MDQNHPPRQGKKYFAGLLSGLLLLVTTLPAQAVFDKNEPLIYPAGIPTGDVLKSKEWYVAAPMWGWLAYGLEKNLTIAFDYPALLIAGIPGLAARWQTPLSSENFKLGVELYGAHFYNGYEDKRNPQYTIVHGGFVGWARAVSSLRLSSALRFHVYLGPDYVSNQIHRPGTNPERGTFEEQRYSGKWSPSLGLGIEWKMADWIFFHANATHGNTFFYIDQVPYKSLAAYSFHMAPFPNSWVGILRRMRLEFTALWVSAPQMNFYAHLQVPLHSYIYWQWGGD
ncbi:MAG: hypothetical protein K2X47_11180 [Bdellovibrionales bacterium]|nr:hypothetical protein [Bdellovibrionales bacterium]